MNRFSMSRAAAVLAALALPSLAMPAVVFAQTAPAAVSAGPAMSKNVEAHIKALHDQLEITPAEESQWAAFAQVMRNNASQMEQAFQSRGAGLQTMNAVEDLQSYSQIAQVQSDNLSKLAASFQTLYASFPAAQQKIADNVFRAKTMKHLQKSGTP